jgi:hypothetical protein
MAYRETRWGNPRSGLPKPSGPSHRSGGHADDRRLRFVNVPTRRGLTVYTRQRNPEGDWILIKNPKVYSSLANWATTEIFGTEEGARE